MEHPSPEHEYMVAHLQRLLARFFVRHELDVVMIYVEREGERSVAAVGIDPQDMRGLLLEIAAATHPENAIDW